MTRHLPPPWRADKFSGGYVVRDANGFAVAYVYGRSTEAEAMEAKQILAAWRLGGVAARGARPATKVNRAGDGVT